jgi:hypothetical protein
MATVTNRIADALAEYEAEHAFARQVLLPVEDRPKYLPRLPQENRLAGYRWFRTANVVCLEKYRLLKARGRL